MVSHQVLQYEGTYKGAMLSTMASHQVLHQEDPKKAEMFSTMAPHQVLHYEDHCKGGMGSQGVQQPGNEVESVSVLTEAENVSAPTEVELDVTTDPEVEKQTLSLAPSNNEGIIRGLQLGQQERVCPYRGR